MKKIFLLVTSLILISCTTRVNVNENENDFKQTNIDGKRILLYKGEPFTGVLYNNYKDTDQIEFEEEYTDGVLDGISRNYSETGEIVYESNYKGGVKHGLYFEKYNNGNFRIQREYTMGEKSGPQKRYFENGQIEEDFNYNESSKRVGEQKKYFENGQIREYIKYSDKSERVGDYFEYYENGQIKESGQYDIIDNKGQRVGVWKEYYESGVVRNINPYDKKGDRNGVYISFTEESDTLRFETFKNDKSNGEKVEFSKGKRSRVENYKDDKLDGLIETYNNYDKKGRYLTETGNYKKGKKVGVWKEYSRSRRTNEVYLSNTYEYDSNGKRIEYISYNTDGSVDYRTKY